MSSSQPSPSLYLEGYQRSPRRMEKPFYLAHYDIEVGFCVGAFFWPPTVQIHAHWENQRWCEINPSHTECDLCCKVVKFKYLNSGSKCQFIAFQSQQWIFPMVIESYIYILHHPPSILKYCSIIPCRKAVRYFESRNTELAYHTKKL